MGRVGACGVDDRAEAYRIGKHGIGVNPFQDNGRVCLWSFLAERDHKGAG